MQTLTDEQKRFASSHLIMGSLLSAELVRAIMRVILTFDQDGKPEMNIVQFACGAYLEFGKDFTCHFTGEFASLTNQVFPNLHKTKDTLMRASLRDRASSGQGASFGLERIEFDPHLARVFWNSARLAQAVGRDATLYDFIAALGTDDSASAVLAKNGISLKNKMPDFYDEFGTVLLSFSFFAHEGWPTQKEFDLDERFVEPYTLEIYNPFAQFRPVKEGTVTLNGEEIALLSEKTSTQKLLIRLQAHNILIVKLKGKTLEGIQTVIRGFPGHR